MSENDKRQKNLKAIKSIKLLLKKYQLAECPRGLLMQFNGVPTYLGLIPIHNLFLLPYTIYMFLASLTILCAVPTVWGENADLSPCDCLYSLPVHCPVGH